MNDKQRVQVAIGAALYPVGELIFETDGRRQGSVFTYDQRWIDRPGAFALAPSMPLDPLPIFSSGDRESRRSALPGPISDTTPDSWGRGIIAKALGTRPTEIEYLLSVNDFTRQGALRFLDKDGNPLSPAHPSTPRYNNIETVQRFARLMENRDADPAEQQREANERMGYVGSLGGARPKSDFDDDGTLAIAKFTSERDTTAIERMEVATLGLAAEVGLRAAEARILDLQAKYPVAIIKRFDRNEDKRRHYISAQTFLGLQEARGGAYTDLADMMREYCGGEEDVLRELHELHNRILFTILVSNNDDHLKNHGFLYADADTWVLAPAFDINPQPERHRSLETAIIEGAGTEASIDLAIEAAPFFEIDEDQVRANAARMAQTITERWATHGRRAGMTSAEINSYAPAFKNEEMTKALAYAEPAPRRRLRTGSKTNATLQRPAAV
jgi:serine/threonine-protein kinase HipA